MMLILIIYYWDVFQQRKRHAKNGSYTARFQRRLTCSHVSSPGHPKPSVGLLSQLVDPLVVTIGPITGDLDADAGADDNAE